MKYVCFEEGPTKPGDLANIPFLRTTETILYLEQAFGCKNVVLR